MPSYPQQNKINTGIFFTIQWTGFALAFILLIFRLAVRWRTFRKFALDDGLLILSAACFLVNCILWHVELPKTYSMYSAFPGHGPPKKSALKESASFLRSLIAFNILFIFCLWSVKFSFLAFFWRLGKGSQGRHYWLWIVAFITLGTFATAIGDYGWGCSRGSDAELLRYCATEKARKDQSNAFRVNTAFDIATDCLILSIPIVMVWRLRLPLAKKLVLFGLFSLTVITMLVALVRMVVVPKRRIGSDITWSFTWSNIEMAISVMVASMGAFRQLYTAKARSDRCQESRYQPSSPSKLKFSFISKPKFQSSGSSGNQTEAPERQDSLDQLGFAASEGGNEGHHLSLQAIHIPGQRARYSSVPQ